jgi:arylsulfatase A-like enzyme
VHISIIRHFFVSEGLAMSGFAAETNRPNTLFIVADDVCTQVAKVAQTPHFDALAARGVRFDRAYVR